MGKRFNVFVSDEAYLIIKNFQKINKFTNRDMALDEFILKHGDKFKNGETEV